MATQRSTLPAAPGPIPIIHPLLFAIYPLLGLYANNIGITPVGFLMRPVAISAVAALGVWTALCLVSRKAHKAGAIASLVILASVPGWRVLEFVIRTSLPYVGAVPTPCYYIAYGLAAIVGLAVIARYWRKQAAKWWAAILAGGLVGVPVFAELVLFGAHNRGAAWYISVYLVGVLLLLVFTLRYQGDFRRVTRTANWFGAVLILLYLLLIFVNRSKATSLEFPPLEPAPPTTSGEDALSRPDIYFLVLDGYPRSDDLRSRFAYNNLIFEQTMQDLGFEIASEGCANYTNQECSLTACLNMDFLPSAVDSLSTLFSAYHANRVFRFLRDRGYVIHAFPSGIDSLAPRPGEIDCTHEPAWSMTEFESVFLSGTAGSRLLQKYYAVRYDNPAYWRLESRRKRVLYAFETLPVLAGEASERPRFVFVRLPVPGPPFLFTRDGDRAKPFGAAAVGDDREFQGSYYEFSIDYVQQTHFISRKLQETVRKMLEAASRPAVILITAGQGYAAAGEEPGSGDYDPFAIPILVRFPSETGEPGAVLPPATSLVNLFRIVFNRVFDSQLPLRPDTRFASAPDNPLDFRPASPDSEAAEAGEGP